MMYYRVAIYVDPSSTWQWKSTVLSSLHTLLQFLRLYRALPSDRLRVLFATSPERLYELLALENQGVGSSAMAGEFLWDQLI